MNCFQTMALRAERLKCLCLVLAEAEQMCFLKGNGVKSAEAAEFLANDYKPWSAVLLIDAAAIFEGVSRRLRAAVGGELEGIIYDLDRTGAYLGAVSELIGKGSTSVDESEYRRVAEAVCEDVANMAWEIEQELRALTVQHAKQEVTA